jgi:RNA polymerase sigma factor (TIGR02999 family)
MNVHPACRDNFPDALLGLPYSQLPSAMWTSPAVNSASSDPIIAAATQQPYEIDALFNAVYARLKQMAHQQLARQNRGTLDTTALVHELYLRINARQDLVFEHRGQFFAYAARAMRHLLINHARDRLRQCAGGDLQRVTLTDDNQQRAVESAEHALALDKALSELELINPRAGRVVELRYFAGLTLEQAAESLNLTRRTVDRDWRFARAFLNNLLG